MKRAILIIFTILFLLFNVNAVNAVLIEYSYEIEVSATGTGDPLGLDGGSIIFSWEMDSELVPNENWPGSSYSLGNYFDVATTLEVTGASTGALDSIDVGDVQIRDSSIPSTDDRIVWYLEVEIDDGDYAITFDALFNYDFISDIYPFAFSESDINGALGVIAVIPEWVQVYEGTMVAASGTPVPEPATMLLLGSGLIGLAGFSRKKFKK